MSAALAVIVVGSAALVAVALLIGLTDRSAQNSAWDRIAHHRSKLAEWERELRATTEAGLCPVCRRRRDPDQFM